MMGAGFRRRPRTVARMGRPRPRIQALIEHRARLAEVLEHRSHDAAERLRRLQAWCAEAEASGVRACGITPRACAATR